MGFALSIGSEKHCPTLICDGCGRPIEDWRQGIVTFPMPDNQLIVPAYVFHKVKCDPKGEDFGELCQQLDQYRPWLLWNHEWGTRRKTEHGWELVISITPPDDL